MFVWHSSCICDCVCVCVCIIVSLKMVSSIPYEAQLVYQTIFVMLSNTSSVEVDVDIVFSWLHLQSTHYAVVVVSIHYRSIPRTHIPYVDSLTHRYRIVSFRLSRLT